jgi:hypothetical protein
MIGQLLNILIPLVFLPLSLIFTHVLLMFLNINNVLITELSWLVLAFIPKYGYFHILKSLLYTYQNDTFTITRFTKEINQSLFSGKNYKELETDFDKTKKFLYDLKDLQQHLVPGKIYKFKTHDKIVNQIEKSKHLKIKEMKLSGSCTYNLILKIMGRDKEGRLNHYKIKMVRI